MIYEFNDFTTVTTTDRRQHTSPAMRAEQLMKCRSNLPLQVKMRESTYFRQRLMRDL